MKKVGIIVADENELSNIPWKIKKSLKINQFNFLIFENEVILVHSGIGIANAASATQELISSFKVTEIWNYGAVGANTNLQLYDLIAPERIYYFDVNTPWYPQGQLPGEKPYFINNLKLNKKNNLSSGSSFLVNHEKIVRISNDLNVDIFDMEAAAIAQIADKNNIKIFIVKCVSDIIGQNKIAHQNINEQIALAGKKALNFILENLT